MHCMALTNSGLVVSRSKGCQSSDVFVGHTSSDLQVCVCEYRPRTYVGSFMDENAQHRLVSNSPWIETCLS